MKINTLLQDILNEVNNKNVDQIVGKYLKGKDLDLIIDGQDLLLQLIKSFEKHLFSTILNSSAEIEGTNEK